MTDESVVLMVERDPGLRVEVQRRLAGPEVALRFDDGRGEIGDLVASARPDVIVLELGGYRAAERLGRVRAVTDAPVIALLDRVVDCVDVLEQGADDYLEKPLAPRELVAKVRSALRRLVADRVESPIVLAGVVIDLNCTRVVVDGRPVRMPKKECALLACLAARPGRVFGRHELLETVWSASEAWLGPATVTEHVRRLRRRLSAAHARVVIETVRGCGYRIRQREHRPAWSGRDDLPRLGNESGSAARDRDLEEPRVRSTRCSFPALSGEDA